MTVEINSTNITHMLTNSLYFDLTFTKTVDQLQQNNDPTQHNKLAHNHHT